MSEPPAKQHPWAKYRGRPIAPRPFKARALPEVSGLKAREQAPRPEPPPAIRGLPVQPRPAAPVPADRPALQPVPKPAAKPAAPARPAVRPAPPAPAPKRIEVSTTEVASARVPAAPEPADGRD
ncbi:MAG: hypothetical protein NTV51_19400, partial [Verrucomicrobia bacterium]|nr:hypothetical protein [Verrucomicrobiota bacterium]